MPQKSNLRLNQVPSAFIAMGEKHNAIVDLLRTMTGTGMCSVVFSEGKIIISVPTVSVTSGGVPDPLTIGTINVTNLNAVNESVSFLNAVSATAGLLYATDFEAVNIDATSITATQFWGDLSAGTVTSSNIYATTVTANQFAGNLNATTVTATNLKATTVTATNLRATSVTATQFWGNLAATSVTATDIAGDYVSAITVDVDYVDATKVYATTVTAVNYLGTNLDVVTITATHLDGNITSTSITVSYRLYSPRIEANTITTDELYLDSLSAITVDATDAIFDYVDSVTANLDQITAVTITSPSITATSITSAQYFGGNFYSNKNGVVSVDGHAITFYVDGYNYSDSTATRYLSASSNFLAYFGESGITINNNSSGKALTLLSSSITRDITLREIDVCANGTPKKMTILATAAY